MKAEDVTRFELQKVIKGLN